MLERLKHLNTIQLISWSIFLIAITLYVLDRGVLNKEKLSSAMSGVNKIVLDDTQCAIPIDQLDEQKEFIFSSCGGFF